MRHPVLLFALTLSLACSSADNGVVPPPPPGGTVPSVLAVQAGDGQQAEPGAALTVKPMVAVKDSAGRGVVGVTVSFTVDSGGGSLQSATATTATDGTASPGDWHLGAGEGRNVMSARAAALASVKFVATAAIAPVTIPDQSVGTGGGTMTVNRLGSPINGMRIVVPAGAFPATQTVGISYASNSGFSHPAGSTLISPLITVHTTSGALAESPMLITIPVTVPNGSFPQVVLRDPATGRQRALPTVDYDATSVTAMTGHFNGSRLMGSDGKFSAGIRGAGMRDPAATGDLVVVALPLDQLSLDHDTSFRPGVDDWEFHPTATVTEDDFSMAVVATEAWYYIAQKPEHGNLWKQFQEAGGVDESNRSGLRWVSVAESDIYHKLTDDVTSVVYALVGLGRGTGGTVRQRLAVASFNAVRAALTSSPGEPQMVLVTNSADPVTAVLVYRSTGQQLFAADPNNPGATIVIDFSSGNMAPLTFGKATTPYTGIIAPGISILEDDGELPSQWSDVEAGTIGDNEFPTYRPMIAWGTAVDERTELKGGVVYAFDTNSPIMWVDCVTCIGEPRTPSIPPGSETVGFLPVFTQKGTAPWQFRDGTSALATDLATPGDLKVGAYLGTHRTAGDTKFFWTDWIAFTIRRLVASIAPASPTGAPNTDVSLTLSITGAPGNLEYLWDFADGPLVTTTTLATTHKWATAGTYTTKVTARDQTTKQPVAKATATVTITPPKLAWRLTSLTKVAEVGNVTQQNITAFWTDYPAHTAIMNAALATPASAAIYQYLFTPGRSSQSIGLQLTGGAAPNLSLYTAGSGNNDHMPLALECSVATQDCGTNSLTITGDNKSGTITGTLFPVSTFSATKGSDGVTLTGTFRVSEGGPGQPQHYVDYQFSAQRVP